MIRIGWFGEMCYGIILLIRQGSWVYAQLGKASIFKRNCFYSIFPWLRGDVHWSGSSLKLDGRPLWKCFLGITSVPLNHWAEYMKPIHRSYFDTQWSDFLCLWQHRKGERFLPLSIILLATFQFANTNATSIRVPTPISNKNIHKLHSDKYIHICT
jgi:hypothetical protein